MPLQIIRQDITKMKVDAIVNTTNECMIGYSGVDLAVHTVAGEELDAECADLVPLGLGEAKITGGYRLPCKYVIHTSGPIWFGGLQGERAILRSCYLESLKLAVANQCRSVAFPLISSGAYGYPKDQVLRFAVQTITEFLYNHELMVYLCVFDRESYSFSQKLFCDIQSFLADAPKAPRAQSKILPKVVMRSACSLPPKKERAPNVSEASGISLQEYLKQMDQSFQEMLFDLIDQSGMTDVECYKRANVDKRTFSKIKSSKDYKPSKQTAIAFAISLRLDMEATQRLLATLGFTLSRSNRFDKIIQFFIQSANYDIFEINEALFEFDQKLLGSF